MANDSVQQALGLKGRSFEYVKKRYDCTDVRQAYGKVTVFCVNRTFVWMETQLPAFLSEIRVLDGNGPQKPAFVPDKEKITLKPNTVEVIQHQAEVTSSIATADKITAALEVQFNVLSGKPTEEDYKKAEAMSKLANTMVSVAQTKINYLKLKNGK